VGSTERRTITFGAGGTTGFKTNVSYNAQEFETTAVAYIGALPNSSSSKFEGTIIGNITVGDRLRYIPCIRESDGAIGYYELMNRNFLEAQGSGTPVAGAPDITHMALEVVGTPEVLSVAANMFSQDNYLDAYCAAGGTITTHNNSRCFVIECKPDTEYRCIFDNSDVSAPRCVINGFAKQPEVGMKGTQVCYSSPNTSAKLHDTTFTTESDVHYLVLWLMYNKNDSDTIKAVDKTVLYETVTAQTASAVDLLAVDNYKDTQDIISGAITRRVGVKVLDGTESWNDTDFSQYNRVYVTISDSANAANVRVLPALCSHFVNLHNREPIGDVVIGQFYASSKQYYFHIPQSSLDEFKAWLAAQYAAGTPVIVLYPLAEPTTEQTTPQPLSTVKGDNLLTVTAEVDDITFDVTYTKKQ